MTSTSHHYKGFNNQYMNKTRKQIQITIGNNRITATLNASSAAEDFAALLPLTLSLTDLFGQQKYARLPISLP